jgi:hypothetical protein
MATFTDKCHILTSLSCRRNRKPSIIPDAIIEITVNIISQHDD